MSLLLALILLLTLAACSGGGDASSADVSESEASSAPAASEPALEAPSRPEQTAVNPLTGLPTDEQTADLRPVAVMINNIHSAQPLLGVSSADVIYECLVEGGITRLLAVFQDVDGLEQIGSIRSARPTFINLARGLDAVYFNLGGSEEAFQMLADGVVDNVSLGNYPDLFWRDPDRRKNLGYEHSALISGELIEQGISQRGIRRTLNESIASQKFGENSPVQSGEAAASITANFSSYKSTEFAFDETSGEYLISQFGKAQTDGAAGRQNTAANVLCLRVNSYVTDSMGHVSHDLVGSGSGYYMSGGKAIPVKWSKAGYDEPIRYTTESGEELTMLPGRIYVCMVPPSQTIVFN